MISTASLPLIHAGKVRRLYALDDPNTVLIVATDAISAYDHVLPTPIPDKGAILTQLSVWWGDQLRDIVPNHTISTEVPVDVQGRAVIAERLEMIPVECVARGYITGSGWAEYQVNGTIAGQALPPGLQHADRLPEPIFTPSSKAPQGEHDENISYDQLVDLVGEDTAEQLTDLTLYLYARGARIAAERGIILADTKFEFGRRPDGTIVLADEILTPDSSRFWDAALWQPGSQIPSFDKQYVRDWLAYDSGWDKTSDAPPPELPRVVVDATRDRYLEAYSRLTSHSFVPPTAPPVPTPAAFLHEAAAKFQPRTRYVVNVMPKPEILDPQGKAVTAELTRMGYDGYSVRQGKRFEIEAAKPDSPATLAEVEAFAESLLANTVIEDFAVALDTPSTRPVATAPAADTTPVQPPLPTSLSMDPVAARAAVEPTPEPAFGAAAPAPSAPFYPPVTPPSALFGVSPAPTAPYPAETALSATPPLVPDPVATAFGLPTVEPVTSVAPWTQVPPPAPLADTVWPRAEVPSPVPAPSASPAWGSLSTLMSGLPSLPFAPGATTEPPLTPAARPEPPTIQAFRPETDSQPIAEPNPQPSVPPTLAAPVINSPLAPTPEAATPPVPAVVTPLPEPVPTSSPLAAAAATLEQLNLRRPGLETWPPAPIPTAPPPAPTTQAAPAAQNVPGAPPPAEAAPVAPASAAPAPAADGGDGSSALLTLSSNLANALAALQATAQAVTELSPTTPTALSAAAPADATRPAPPSEPTLFPGAVFPASAAQPEPETPATDASAPVQER